ncbi:MAG: ArsR family transcriptional regulator [Candidatus ainarchaeum sp.]|nr:ArsR family transcriptional regulator [Candidatus ainarchaeum sp.]
MHSIKHLLNWLILGSKGGETRKKILLILKKKPMNNNNLAKEINMDYKTVQHHIKILQENQLISSIGNKYGQVYIISQLLEDEIDLFKKMIGDED